jgi:hypothetical protein
VNSQFELAMIFLGHRPQVIRSGLKISLWSHNLKWAYYWQQHSLIRSPQHIISNSVQIKVIPKGCFIMVILCWLDLTIENTWIQYGHPSARHSDLAFVASICNDPSSPCRFLLKSITKSEMRLIALFSPSLCARGGIATVHDPRGRFGDRGAWHFSRRENRRVWEASWALKAVEALQNWSSDAISTRAAGSCQPRTPALAPALALALAGLKMEKPWSLPPSSPWLAFHSQRSTRNRVLSLEDCQKPIDWSDFNRAGESGAFANVEFLPHFYWGTHHSEHRMKFQRWLLRFENWTVPPRLSEFRHPRRTSLTLAPHGR